VEYYVSHGESFRSRRATSCQEWRVAAVYLQRNLAASRVVQAVGAMQAVHDDRAIGRLHQIAYLAAEELTVANTARDQAVRRLIAHRDVLRPEHDPVGAGQGAVHGQTVATLCNE